LVAKHSRDAIIPRRAVEIHSLESDAAQHSFASILLSFIIS
jgi:hypothetical protein